MKPSDPILRSSIQATCAVALLLACSQVSHAQTNPVLHWPLEEGNGASTTEAVSGEATVAQFVNGPTWTAGLAPGSSHAVRFQNTNPGSYIDAGTLQTDDHYVSAASAVDSAVLSTEWTIGGWIELPEDPLFSEGCILTSDTDATRTWWLFFIRGTNGISTNLGFDFNSVRVFSNIRIPREKPVFVSISANSTADSFGPGMRHRFAMWDGASWTYQTGSMFSPVRLDGIEMGSFNDGTRQFDGSIDAMRIYDKALSDEELTALALNNTIGGELGAVVTAPQSPIGNPSLEFAVQFTEDVTGFDASDLNVIADPSLAVGAPVITGSGSTYTVTIGATGNGPLSLGVIPGAGVQTLSKQPLVNSIPSAEVEVDQTPPAITAFTLLGSNPTGALDIGFHVSFSEPVSGFNNAGDLSIAHSGTSHTGVTISGAGADYTVTLTGVTGAGTFDVQLDPAGGTADAAGNAALVGVTSATVTHFIDGTPPTVVSFAPDTAGPVSSNSVIGFTVVFSEPVLGFIQSAIIRAETNLQDASIYDISTVDNITYTMSADAWVTDGQTSGTLAGTIDLAAGITDLAGNALVGPSPTSDAVVFTATDYQLWAVAKGLTAGVNFSSTDDADLDGRINGVEFVRDGDPLVAGDPIKQRGHLAEVGGQKHGVLTIAAPDGFVYSSPLPGRLEAFLGDYWGTISVGDIIDSSTDLVTWPSATAPLIEDPSISTPVGMPPLTPGWSYRHFRITDPTTTLPRAFIKAEAVED